MPQTVSSSDEHIDITSLITMDTKERLKRIAEIDLMLETREAYDEKKKTVERKEEEIKNLKKELETQTSLVASVNPDVLSMISNSASRSRDRRRGGGTVDIDESARRAEAEIRELSKKLVQAEEELVVWEGELERLDKDLDNVGRNSPEELRRERESLENP